MEVLTLKMIGLICLGPCRRGMQNEILASHFEVHLNLMCWIEFKCIWNTLQFQLWLPPVVYITGQPRSGTCTSECPGTFRAPLSLPGAISHGVAVISTTIGGTPKLFFLLVFFFLPFFLACFFFFSNKLAYYCFKCPELNTETWSPQ